MIGRIASCVLATLVGQAPVCASAFAGGSPAQVVPATQIAALAERVARSSVPDPDRALAPAFPIADQRVPLGAVVIVAGVPQINSTFVSVPIAIDIDGKLTRTVVAGYRITTYVRMTVAAHDLPAGAVLLADDLAYVRVPFNGRPALGFETFVGRKIRAVMARGDAVYPELTMVNEIVLAGMPALLIVHDGPVRLSADVIARNSGGLGDTVIVFNPQTQKALSGIVTAPNVVELTLPEAN